MRPVGQVVVAAPAGQEHVRDRRSRARPRAGARPPTRPGKPPSSTSGAGCSKRSRARACARISSGTRLTSVKRPDVEQHRAAAANGRELLVGVGDAARLARLVPAARLLDQPAAPVGEPRLARPRPAVEPGGVEAVGRPDDALGIHPEQVRHPPHRVGREHEQPLAAAGPAAHPLGPLGGVVPARRRPLVDLAQHQQLGAVQVADPRHVGEGALGGLVDRRQVMEVQDVGVRRARLGELRAPRRPPGARSPRRRPRAKTRSGAPGRSS